METESISRILGGLGSSPQEAWAEFLELYAPLLLQVVRLREQDPDHVSDCFLFVCEKLAQNQFRRLRRFKPKGPASFPTWLRAVARNLCIDWRRQRFGRFRVFRSVARLPALEREVFHCVYDLGMGLDETFFLLRPRYPALSEAELTNSLKRVRQSLSPRQRWLASARKLGDVLLGGARSETEDLSERIADQAPNPEALAFLNERRHRLARALSRLPKKDRLLIRLRFEQELTLEQVSRVMKLDNAQSADQRIRKVLKLLREELK